MREQRAAEGAGPEGGAQRGERREEPVDVRGRGWAGCGRRGCRCRDGDGGFGGGAAAGAPLAWADGRPRLFAHFAEGVGWPGLGWRGGGFGVGLLRANIVV